MAIVFISIVLVSFPMMLINVGSLRSQMQDSLEIQATVLARNIEFDLNSGNTFNFERVDATLPDDFQVRVFVDGELIAVVHEGTSFGLTGASGQSGKVRVELAESSRRIDAAVAQSLLISFSLGAVSAVFAWWLARYLSNKLQRPIDDFVEAADRIGSGDTRTRTKRYGLRELDQIAEVLDTTGQRIEYLLDMERRMTNELSHQLRTPLTALTLRIEEIRAMADEPSIVKAEAESALSQVERITQVMQDLIQARRGEPEVSSPQSVVLLMESVLDEIRTALNAQNRQLISAIPPDLMTTAAPGAVRHVVSILLENSVLHGAGDVTIRLEQSDRWIVAVISDEGEGLTPTEARVFSDDVSVSGVASTRIGLSLATSLVSAQRGKIEWRQEIPATIRLYLPSVDEYPSPIGEESK